MGCCNSKKFEQSELDLQSLEVQSGLSTLLNNDGVDDLILAGSAITFGASREESTRKKLANQLSILEAHKKDEDSLLESQLPINTPTFGQLGKKLSQFKFEEPTEPELQDVQEEHTFGATGTEPVPSLA